MEKEALQKGKDYIKWKKERANFATNINYIREQLKKKKPQLVINKVPKDTLTWFIKLADERFDGDRGWALRWLKDMYVPESQMLWDKLAEFEARLVELENQAKNLTKTKKIKMVDGSERKCTS